MKRRSFLQGLAAGTGTLALPLPLAAKPATAAAAHGTRLAAFHYGWACVFAQMNNGIAPADIADKFGVPRAQADALFKRMLDRGVLCPPGLDGRSHATRPWQPWDKRTVAPASKNAQRTTDQTRTTSAQAFRAMIRHVTADMSYGWTPASQHA